MVKKKSEISIPDEVVLNRIYMIRGEKVILDKDLAELYTVETKQLKRQVRRNIDRFPEDFMFELSKEELEVLRSQFGTSSWGGSRYIPMAFTEQGVAMLSSVLNNPTAIKVNIQIMRLFTRMRKMMNAHQEILSQLEQMRQAMVGQDERIDLIFEYFDKMENDRNEPESGKPRRMIGFGRQDEE